jgi:hypothetical protein
LSIDVHEAKNIHSTFISSLLGSANSLNTTNLNKNQKDNFYYCLILLNNEAFIASTHLVKFSDQSGDGGSSSNFSSSSLYNENLPANEFLNSIIGSADCDNLSAIINKDVIWDDSFSFDDLPLNAVELKICLFMVGKPNSSLIANLKKISEKNSNSNHPVPQIQYQHHQTSKKMIGPILLGYINIKLEDLMNRGTQEQWFRVESALSTSSTATNMPIFLPESKLRLKLRFCEEKIYLNKNFYKSLSNYLLDEHEHQNLCIIYEQILPTSERAHFVEALLKFFIVSVRKQQQKQNNKNNDLIIQMLKSFLHTEIERCAEQDMSTLFRPATLCTSLMDQYMRTRCNLYLKCVLQDTLVSIFKKMDNNSTTKSSSSFELDPTKCVESEQRQENLALFKDALKELINSICSENSVNLFPSELKHLFFYIKQQVFYYHNLNNNNNISSNKLVNVYCVSAFVFLRLLCPAMLNPKNFNLNFNSSLSSSILLLGGGGGINSMNNFALRNYEELAKQFGVFSPEFLFTLSPKTISINHNHNKITQNSFKKSSSSDLLLLRSVSKESSINQINCFNVTSMLNSNSSSSSSSSYSSTSALPGSSSSAQFTSIYDRNIKLLAKVLNAVANMTECKEPFMLPISEFLVEFKPKVIKFIDEISSQSELIDFMVRDEEEEAIQETTTCFDEQDDKNEFLDKKDKFKMASCKYLAILNRILYSITPQMIAHVNKLIDKTASSTITIADSINQDNQNASNDHQIDLKFVHSLNNLILILKNTNN